MSEICRFCSVIQVLPLTENSAEGNPALFEVDEKEVRLEVMRARGAGGQVFNESASIRFTHLRVISST
jgi:protein subunit release factor A